MSAPIGSGDWVERIGSKGSDAHRASYSYPNGKPEFGRVYRVRDVGFARDYLGNRDPSITLYGFGEHEWWPACCFRPIYRPNSEIIEALKQPAPERELEDA